MARQKRDMLDSSTRKSPLKGYTRERYMKERRRVQNLIYKLRKRGYNITSDSVLKNIPTGGYSSATKRLEKIRTQLDIAKQYLGEESLRAPRPVASNASVSMPKWYDIEMISLKEQISQLDDVPAKFLNKYIDMAEKEVGRERLMEAIKYLEDQEGLKVTYKFKYDPALFQRYLWEVTRFIDMSDEEAEKVWDEYETLIGEYRDAVGDYEFEDY